MSHWRTFLDSDVIRYVDLDGKDHVVTIASVKRGKVTGALGKSTAKAMIMFDGKPKPLAAGTAILTQIGALFGNDTKDWVNKTITIWPDPSVQYGGAAVGGIRVRSVLPKKEASNGG